MKRFVFWFTDSDFEDKGHEVPDATYYIPLNGSPDKDYDGDDDDDLIEFTSDMEEYGVHNYCTTGEPDGTFNEIIGYNSYEIKASDWDEVMQKWHEWLASEGWEPGEIVKVTPKEYYEKFYPWTEYQEK